LHPQKNVQKNLLTFDRDILKSTDNATSLPPPTPQPLLLSSKRIELDGMIAKCGHRWCGFNFLFSLMLAVHSDQRVDQTLNTESQYRNWQLSTTDAAANTDLPKHHLSLFV